MRWKRESSREIKDRYDDDRRFDEASRDSLRDEKKKK